jgi:hypothetical protein
MFIETAYYVEGRAMSGTICGGCGAEMTVPEAERDACGICGWRISQAQHAQMEAVVAAINIDPEQKPWPEEALLW